MFSIGALVTGIQGKVRAKIAELEILADAETRQERELVRARELDAEEVGRQIAAARGERPEP